MGMTKLRAINGIDPNAIGLARRAYDADIKDRLRGKIVDLIRDLAPNVDREVRRGHETLWRNHGSLKAHHSGLRRGQWIDREAGGKANGAAGGPLDAIKFYAGVSNYRDQIAYAASWLGVPQFDPADAIRLDRDRIEKQLAERRRLTEEAARRQAEKDAREAEEKIGRARAAWDACEHIAGTPGEVYLRAPRAIPFDTAPISIRWSNDLQAIAYAITNRAGDVVSIQYEAVTPDGEKDRDRLWRNDPKPRPKDTIAPIRDGDAFRLPGPIDGPLFIGEGPITALSSWAAGVESMATVGPINLDRIPHLVEKGRRVLIAFDDDPYTGKHSANRKVFATRRRKINALRRDGYDVVAVLPFETRRGRKEDFNDLLKQRGIDAVRCRLRKFASPGESSVREFVDLDVARKELERVIDQDMRSLIEWVRSEDAEFAPAMSYKITAGVGKTDAVVKALIPILRHMRANGDNRTIVIAVPFHDLGDDVRERYQHVVEAEAAALDQVEKAVTEAVHGEFVARSYRGREARKPRSVDQMCGNIDTIREAMRKKVRDLTKEVCRAECPLRDGCAYLAQKTERADIWLVSHATLFSKLPAPISKSGGVAMVVVDETPWQAGVPSDAEILIRTIPDMPLGDGDKDDVDRFDLVRQHLLDCVKENGEGPLRASILRRGGFDEESAEFAADRERARTITDGPWRERDPNVTVGPMVRAWSAIREMLATRKERTGWLRVEKDSAGNLTLRVRKAMAISKDWRVPTLHLDASLDPTLLRFFWPRLEERGVVAVDAPHAVVLQATTRSFAKSQLEPLFGEIKSPEAEKIDKARRIERRRVKAFIAARHRENGGSAFVVSNKRTIEGMGLESLHGVDVGHFNAICGKDGWGRVRSGFVIGRTQPDAGEAERVAEALSGDVIDPIGSEYARGDGFRLIRRDGEIVRVPCEVDQHPHPIAERVRRRIADEEVYQAIHRARLVARSPADPVTVYVLSDVALPMVIDGEIDPDAIRYPSPRDAMLGEGGVAFESSATACLAYPGLWASPDALRRALSDRRKVEIEKGVAGAISVSSSYNKILLGQTHTVPAAGHVPVESLVRVEFQRSGPKLHREAAYIDPRRVTDPRSAIEAMVGPLVWFWGPDSATAPAHEPIALPIAVGAEIMPPPDPPEPPAARYQPVRTGAPPAAEPIPAAGSDQGDTGKQDNQDTLKKGERAIDAAPPAASMTNFDGGHGPVAETTNEGADDLIEEVEEAGEDEPPIPVDVWGRLWECAADAAMTHAAVAEAVKISACHLSNIEKGRRRPRNGLRGRIEQFIATAAPVQGRLL